MSTNHLKCIYMETQSSLVLYMKQNETSIFKNVNLIKQLQHFGTSNFSKEPNENVSRRLIEFVVVKKTALKRTILVKLPF